MNCTFLDGASTIIFLILGTIATVLHSDKFIYIGAYLFYAAFVFFLLFLVIWRREQIVSSLKNILK